MIVKEPKYYWEDFEVGEVHQLGEKYVGKDEIIAFAKQFDPQPFHVDEAAAKASIYGGLIASGWHTVALVMRMMCDSYMLDSASLGSPGIDNLKWLKPVYAGDEISFAGVIVAKRESRSRPGWGIISMEVTGANQKGEPVFAYTGHVFVAMGAVEKT